MRRGCTSLGETQCDRCQRIIPHSERYIAINEDDGVEVDEGEIARYCVDCAQEKGYAHYKEEKNEKMLTFFPELDF